MNRKTLESRIMESGLTGGLDDTVGKASYVEALPRFYRNFV